MTILGFPNTEEHRRGPQGTTHMSTEVQRQGHGLLGCCHPDEALLPRQGDRRVDLLWLEREAPIPFREAYQGWRG